MKKLMMILAAASILMLSTATLSAMAPDTQPKSVIHVVTVNWKAGTTPEQIQAALDGVKALPKEFEGITRVWTKSIKVQGGKSHAFVMEFKDEAALKEYANSPAQKKWYETYIPIRDASASIDITN